MRAQNRANIANNAQYHQDLADYYSETRPEGEQAAAPAGRNGRRTGQPPAAEQREQRGSSEPTEHEYLAALHAEVAQQLRDVLGGAELPAIIGAENPVARSVPTPRIEPVRRRANAVG
jgi:hypothetical protein